MNFINKLNIQDIKKSMIDHVLMYHNDWDIEDIKHKSWEWLLAHTHYLERDNYKERLVQLELI